MYYKSKGTLYVHLLSLVTPPSLIRPPHLSAVSVKPTLGFCLAPPRDRWATPAFLGAVGAHGRWH